MHREVSANGCRASELFWLFGPHERGAKQLVQVERVEVPSGELHRHGRQIGPGSGAGVAVADPTRVQLPQHVDWQCGRPLQVLHWHRQSEDWLHTYRQAQLVGASKGRPQLLSTLIHEQHLWLCTRQRLQRDIGRIGQLPHENTLLFTSRTTRTDRADSVANCATVCPLVTCEQQQSNSLPLSVVLVPGRNRHGGGQEQGTDSECQVAVQFAVTKADSVEHLGHY